MKSVSTLLLLSGMFATSSLAICPILSTPSYGVKEAIFTVCSNTTINAPASLIYNILTEFDTYHEWNSFVVDVKRLDSSSTYQAGSRMHFTESGLLPLFNTTSNEIITSLDPENTTAVWRFDSPTPELILAEHVSQVVPLGDNKSWYNSWETYYKSASLLLETTLGEKLVSAFEAQGEDLKKRAENLARGGN